ncbi:hypothetical protein GN958_ATG23553 [Phytophthora infestans]|uniref:Uncharacterized protein n=1 Tax=Phytophthora infestans TaxID=4787 RepID=A0A8S9TKM7_PHYIN|nr:hypothetical protein GN958_ATG23553 [Phytophthora infestans]
MAQVTEQAMCNKPSVNGDTPAANKVLGRCYEEMNTSDWIQLFAPKPVRQARWSGLSYNLTRPVVSSTLEQVASEIVLLLQALGLQMAERPSLSMMKAWLPAEAAAEMWKWNEKLR